MQHPKCSAPVKLRQVSRKVAEAALGEEEFSGESLIKTRFTSFNKKVFNLERFNEKVLKLFNISIESLQNLRDNRGNNTVQFWLRGAKLTGLSRNLVPMECICTSFISEGLYCEIFNIRIVLVVLVIFAM